MRRCGEKEASLPPRAALHKTICHALRGKAPGEGAAAHTHAARHWGWGDGANGGGALSPPCVEDLAQEVGHYEEPSGPPHGRAGALSGRGKGGNAGTFSTAHAKRESESE